MSDRTSKVLAALVIGVAIVLAAFVLAPPRYSGFAVDDPNGQTLHGVLDARTGRVCGDDRGHDLCRYDCRRDGEIGGGGS